MIVLKKYINYAIRTQFFPVNISLLFQLLFIVTITSNLASQTQWNTNGIQIASAVENKINVTAISDGQGGSFITWQSNTSNKNDIFAQWIDGTGTIRWEPAGVPVCQYEKDQIYPVICSDGNRGIIIAWEDYRYSKTKIYAQRINAEGQSVWSQNGVRVCYAANVQNLPQITSDDNGGAIITWIHNRYNTARDIYAQRISSAGKRLWHNYGEPVVKASYNQHAHQMMKDNNNGAIIVWQDERNGNSDIYTQRISQNSTLLWKNNGVPIATNSSSQSNPKIIQTSEDSFIIAWQDEQSVISEIYAQKIDLDGNINWDKGGVPVVTGQNSQSNVVLTADMNGGTILAWQDQRNGNYDIYAQRLDFDSQPKWETYGVPVAVLNDDQYSPSIVSDGSGGAIITWSDLRNSIDIDLYAQRIDKNGLSQWDNNGICIASVVNDQVYHTIASDSSGGALLFWQDERNNQSEIYSQSINDVIRITSPQSTTAWPGGKTQKIQWNLRIPSVLFDQLTLRYSISPDDNFSNIIAEDISTSYTELNWLVPYKNTSTVRVKIQAKTQDQNLLYEYITNLFTIDSFPPEEFDLLFPINGTTINPTPTFYWNEASDNVSGINHYELWLDNNLFQDSIYTTFYTFSNDQKLKTKWYTWTIKAVDRAGLKKQAIHTWSFKISSDDQPPDPFHLIQPTNSIWTTGINLTFIWETSVDNNTGLWKYQLWIDDQLKVDNIPANHPFTNISSLTTGYHTWYVIAVDQVSNMRKSEETFIIKVDSDPPSLFQLQSPPNNYWIADATPTFSWQAAEDTGCGLGKYQLWIDDSLILDSIDTTVSSVTIPYDQSLSDGTHTWFIKATDKLGNNRNSSSVFQLKIDTTPPETLFLTFPEDSGFVNFPTPIFKWKETSDSGCGLHHYELWIDNSLSVSELTTNQSVPNQSLTQGTHNWYVQAFDKLGNMQTSPFYILTADWTPPSPFFLSLPSDSAVLHTNLPRLIWYSSKDTISGISKYQLFINNVLDRDKISPSDTITTPSTYLANGIYSWYVRSVDNTGFTRDSESRIITIDCSPPKITSPDTVNAKEDSIFNYTATATDLDEDPPILSFQEIPSWLTPQGFQISGIPGNGITDTSFLVIATDGIFSDTLSVWINVQAVNDSPAVTSPNTAAATEGNFFVYRASAIDIDGPHLIIQFIDYPSWLITSGSEISGIPVNGAQDTTFKVIASDGLLTDTLIVNLTVKAVNDPPFFEYNFPFISIDKTDTLRLNLDDYITDRDDPDSVLSWTYMLVDTNTVFILIDEEVRVALISGYNTDGDFRIVFTATDPHGTSASDTLHLSINLTGVDEIESCIPEKIIIFQPYPNPFNPNVIFSYGLPNLSQVKICIFNLMGQEITTLIDTKKNPGLHKCTWSAADLTSGVYIYYIQIGSQKQTGRILLMK